MAETRVLQVIGSLTRGGAETLLLNLLRAIDRDRYQVDFLVQKEERQAYDDEAEALGSTIHRIAGYRNLLKYGARVTELMEDYDVVHANVYAYNGLLMAWAASAKVPVRISHIHTFRRADEKASLPRRMYLGWMKKLIQRHSTHGFACIPAAGRSLFGKRWDRDPHCRILPNAIDLAPFRDNVDAAAVRAELGLPDSARVVVHVGRFVELKNHAFLLPLFAQLAELDPSLHLLLVGDGPLRTRVEKQANKLGMAGRVHVTGLRGDVPRLLKIADLMILPSKWEGLPLTVVESQAAGVPCLVSDVVPEEAGLVPGFLERVSLEEPTEKWVEKAELSLARPTIDRGAALEHVVRSDYNVERMVKQVTRIYDQARRLREKEERSRERDS